MRTENNNSNNIIIIIIILSQCLCKYTSTEVIIFTHFLATGFAVHFTVHRLETIQWV